MTQADLTTELQRRAEQTAEAIMETARSDARRIIGEAVTRIEARRSAAMEDTERDCRERSRASIAAARHESLRSVLVARTRLLERVMEQARALLPEASTHEGYRQTLPNEITQALEFIGADDAVIECSEALMPDVCEALGTSSKSRSRSVKRRPTRLCGQGPRGPRSCRRDTRKPARTPGPGAPHRASRANRGLAVVTIYLGDINTRAVGLRTRLLSAHDLERLAHARSLFALQRDMRALEIVPSDVPARTTDLERATRRRAAELMGILGRWATDERRDVLVVLLEDEERRSIQTILRGAAEGVAAEARLSGLCPPAASRNGHFSCWLSSQRWRTSSACSFCGATLSDAL